MSVRAVGIRLLKHGKSFVQHICKRDLNTTINEKINVVSKAPRSALSAEASELQVVPSKSFSLRNVGAQLGLQARRVLIDNVLNRVTSNLAGNLRRKATRG